MCVCGGGGGSGKGDLGMRWSREGKGSRNEV